MTYAKTFFDLFTGLTIEYDVDSSENQLELLLREPSDTFREGVLVERDDLRDIRYGVFG